MSAKRWIRNFILLNLIMMFFLVSLNYIIDPYGIFDSKFIKKRISSDNISYVKVDHIMKHYKLYNSYMFGSSRIGTTYPEDIEKYVHGSKFYNFFLSSANMEHYEKHIKLLIEKYKVENIYLQIDLQNMYEFGQSIKDYGRRYNYIVNNENIIYYYLSYLTAFSYEHMKDKLSQKKEDFYFDINKTGTFIFLTKDKLINKNHVQYVYNEKSFHLIKPNKITYTHSIRPRIITSFKNIVNLCKNNDINLIVYITPHNHVMMNTFQLKDIEYFFKELVKVTDFWDFSGYNTITLNNYNYYESSHYMRNVGKLIAARIFRDETVKIPSDFGVLVKQNNINTHLIKLKSDYNKNLY